MYIALGLLGIGAGTILVVFRKAFGAMNELSQTLMTGRRTPVADRHAWTYTPAILGVIMVVAGTVSLVYGVVLGLSH